MRRRRKLLWILLGCGVAAVLILTLWREREPRYEDHSLFEWIAIAEHGDRDGEFSKKEGQEAVRHIGTNAIPFLIKCIEYRERPWQTRLSALSSKFPQKLAEPLSDLIAGHGAQRQETAFSGLHILGPGAKPAIPALTNLLTAQPQLASYCMTVLAQMGSDGLTPVLNAVTNQASPYRIVAIDALVGLDTNQPLDQIVVATLTNCLAETNREFAFFAAQILCCHNAEKELAMKTLVDALGNDDKKLRWSAISHLKISLIHGYSVPAVLQFLQDTNSPLSPYAASVLGELAHDGEKLPETVLPALTNSFRDPRPLVRAYAAGNVAQFKEAAEPAAPALLDLWDDPDQSVRQSATNAFFALPSYSVLRPSRLPPLGMSQEQADIYERRYGTRLPPVRMSQEQADMYERRYGIKSFSYVGSKLLNHSDFRIRQMATNAFRTLSGSNVVDQAAENTSH